MIFAKVNNQKVLPEPGLKGECPFCKSSVIAKCGEINAWHWAHESSENCDVWHEPETYWHYHWKMTFHKQQVEHQRFGWGEWRRADVFTDEDIAIEIQNSAISKQVITDREVFHQPKLIWLINGIGFKEHFEIHPIINRNRLHSSQDNTKKAKNTHSFSWRHYRQCWNGVKFPVFIDFGDRLLFQVIRGMGTSSGEGRYFKKRDFIKKYGGDYEFHQKWFGIK